MKEFLAIVVILGLAAGANAGLTHDTASNVALCRELESSHACEPDLNSSCYGYQRTAHSPDFPMESPPSHGPNARWAMAVRGEPPAAVPYEEWLASRRNATTLTGDADVASIWPPLRLTLHPFAVDAIADEFARRLKPVFNAEGVPEELVWVAEVESSFDPEARSSSGAVGLFQFLPTTAEILGLSLEPVDERKLPEKSASAAAKYLKHLYARFRSWPLALAAYNAGEGLVCRLLASRGARTFDEIAEDLPPETQKYVPKIDATLLRREGKPLSLLSPAA
jgi:soluble lytic murein transglycosylase-like protein